MPLSLRFVVPLALALAAIAYAVVPLVDRLTYQWFVRDLDARGAVIAKTAQEPLVELLREPRGAKARVQRYFDRILQGERVYALGFCDRAGKLAYATAGFPARRPPRTRSAPGCCSSPTARCMSRPTRSPPTTSWPAR
jgi:trehalose 6-phosphate synthase